MMTAATDLPVFRQLQLQPIEPLMGFDNMRGPGHRAVALLVRGNPRNCLKNPTVPMPRVFAGGYGEKLYRIRRVVMGRGRIGRSDSAKILLTWRN